MNKQLLYLLPLALASSSCGESAPQAQQTRHFTFHLTFPGTGDEQSVEYRVADDGIPTVILDGVRFTLLDPAVYELDWEALGVSGIEIKGTYTRRSSEILEDAFLIVQDRAVKVEDGTLTWGETSLGPVTEGDVFVVDANGLRADDRQEPVEAQ